MPAANRYSTWFDGVLDDWKIGTDGPFPYPDLKYFAHVFREVDTLCPDAGLHVVATTEITGPVPVAGRHVVALCLGDELGRVPDYAADVRLVAKTMGGGRRRPYVALGSPARWPAAPIAVALETRVQLRRLPWQLRAARRRLSQHQSLNVLDLPMGIRAFEDLPVIPFAARQYDVGFAGSLVNDAAEQRRRWPSQKVRARRAFVRVLEALKTDRPDLAVWLRVLATHWEGTAATVSYSHALADTRIIPCPRGSSVHTYRYFEALRAGCIPVYETLPHSDYYQGAPGVRVRSWSELPRVVDRLLADPDALLERHRASLAWYDRWVSPRAVAGRIAAALAATG